MDVGRWTLEFFRQHRPQLLGEMRGEGIQHFQQQLDRGERARGRAVRALVQTIICEMAVLKLSFSMSSPTFLIVSWTT